MQLLWKQNGSWIRAPPHDGLGIFIPGEYTLLVGIDQPFGAEISTYRQQAVGITKRLPGSWKFEAVAVNALYGYHADIWWANQAKLSRYLSASSAAMQPNPADVTAWR